MPRSPPPADDLDRRSTTVSLRLALQTGSDVGLLFFAHVALGTAGETVAITLTSIRGPDQIVSLYTHYASKPKAEEFPMLYEDIDKGEGSLQEQRHDGRPVNSTSMGDCSPG
jgi:hypothetical protein